MTILNAALAFALSMLVFSTIVSAMVEAFQQLLQLRRAGMWSLIERLFDEVLLNRYRSSLSGGQEARLAFIEAMVKNRGVSQGWLSGLRYKWIGYRMVTSMTAVQFAERLAPTSVGKAVEEEAWASAGGSEDPEKKAEEHIDLTVDRLARAFDTFGDDLREHFRGRARVFSVLMAISLAVMMIITF